MLKIEAGKNEVLDRILTLELARVTERAAVAAARLRGRGDEMAADQAAVDAMRRELNHLPIDGTVVIGEGERDEAPMLYIGEEVGTKNGPKVDIALDPLEGTTICAKNLPNSLAVIALAPAGGLLNAPDSYMEKIAIGPGYSPGLVDLDAPIAENLQAVAREKGVKIGDVTACVLDRPRHARLIEEIRAAGASIRLIGDGDVAGVIHTTDPDETGIDLYVGIGGAPEGVLAAAALQVYRRPDAGPSRDHPRGAGRTRLSHGDHRYQAQIHAGGNGQRRCALCRNRCHRRQFSSRRTLWQKLHYHAYGRDAVHHGNGALHQGAAHAYRKIPSGLKPAIE